MKPVGMGDVVAGITKAVGIRPCGGCQKRQAALNALVPFHGKPPLPDGFRMDLQGQRDKEVQILLAHRESEWITWLYQEGKLSDPRPFDSETVATADFNQRMRA